MRKYLCVCAVLALAIAGCGSGKGSGSGKEASRGEGSSKPYRELRWGLIATAGPLDWNRNVVAEVPIESLTVNTLMQFQPDGKVKPGLASAVEQPDPTTYVYHLKSVKFSDGRPMTADDVVYSLDRNIRSKEAWAKGYWEDVASIAARDRSTVVVKLKQPNAVLQDIVAFTGQVIEKAAASKAPEKDLGTPGHMLIGTGPWKIDSYRPEVSVELSRNPYWTGPRPLAEKITIDLFKTEASMALALRSGTIDGSSGYQSPKTFANIPGAHQFVAPGATITLASANTRVPPFNDVHVRRALAYASDVKGMIRALFPAGDAVEDPTIMPASLFASLGSESEVSAALKALPKYAFDLGKARQELAKSAYPHGFSTEIQVEELERASVATAEILASDLAKIGITAKIHELPSDEAAAVLFGGKSKLEVNTIYAVYPDPEGVMSSILSPAQIPGGNSANFRNAEVDRLLPESLGTKNPARRLQLIGKLLTVVAEEAPFWPLYTRGTFWTLSEKYVLPKFSFWTNNWGPWALGAKLAS